MEIYLAQTQGFCAGVAYAIDIVETALKKYGTPLYVYHEIVHNFNTDHNFCPALEAEAGWGVFINNNTSNMKTRGFIMVSDDNLKAEKRLTFTTLKY